MSRASKDTNLDTEREESRLRAPVDTGVSPRERLARIAKPAGKAFRRTSDYHDLGDGDLCPVAGHGKMYVTSTGGRQYCPHQTHDIGCPRDASGNDWVNPRQRKETPDGDDAHREA